MVTAILIQAGSLVLNKAAMSKGVNKYTMIVYANALSTLLLPSAFVVHRPSERPPLTFSIYTLQIVLAWPLWVGSLAHKCSAQIFAYIDVDYSSATLGTAMLNLIPAFTFLLAIIFRMENVYWKRSSSQAKVLGTIASITGAFVVTLYKGPSILLVPSSATQFLFSPQHSNWLVGGLFLVADAFFTSLWHRSLSSTQQLCLLCFSNAYSPPFSLRRLL
ncbi:WAT1-related protein At3g28050-like isoform X2 [Rosa rugosa]|uniref:WAT1-related protein At3g28050-like isoform X2 n=1 Tax=Rosa rugosa TaxID=74645 RepID=UPI002B417892|nr:WAT1-related protein At3g28050-like isoform X2 [Rosa rugosa]